MGVHGAARGVRVRVAWCLMALLKAAAWCGESRSPGVSSMSGDGVRVERREDAPAGRLGSGGTKKRSASLSSRSGAEDEVERRLVGRLGSSGS